MNALQINDHLAYLLAVYYIGTRYHSGQDSKGYSLSCLAQQRASREHSALDLGRQLENLTARKSKRIHRPEFVTAVAFYLRKLRKHRFSL